LDTGETDPTDPTDTDADTNTDSDTGTAMKPTIAGINGTGPAGVTKAEAQGQPEQETILFKGTWAFGPGADGSDSSDCQP
jgi:hypothetical protein